MGFTVYTNGEADSNLEEKRIREGLAAAFTFVQSVEINKSLDAITMDQMLSEAIMLLDSNEITESETVTSVDAAEVLFVDEDGTRTVKRLGRLQRLEALAASLFDEATFTGELGFSAGEHDLLPTGNSFFQLAKDYEPNFDEDLETWANQDAAVSVVERDGLLVEVDSSGNETVLAAEVDADGNLVDYNGGT